MKALEKYIMERKKRFFIITLTVLSLSSLAVLINLSVGSQIMNPITVLQEGINQVLRGKYGLPSYRVERAFAASVAGASLALSGLLIQTASRNPLGDPYLLGISSGALLGVVITFLLPPTQENILIVRPIAAFLGGFLAYALTLFIASKAGMTTTSLVLAGVAVGTTLYSVSLLPQYLILQNLTKVFAWSQGSFVDPEPIGSLVLLATLIASTLYAFRKVDVMNALSASDDFVRELGEDPAKVRSYLTFIASGTASLTVAWFGIIGFVGLASPHIARKLLRTGDAGLILPSTLLAGSLMTALSDAVGKSAAYPIEIPVNIIISVVGGPTLAFLLMRLRRSA